MRFSASPRRSQVLVEGTGIGHAGVFERGDDKAEGSAPSGVCSALPTTRRLRHQSVTRAIAEVTEHPGGLARGQAQAPGLRTLFAERGLQAGIACQTEHIIDAMLLAPPHQRLVGEAAETAQNDAHARPRLADLADDARHLFDRAIAAGNIRTPLPGQQQMPAAEHVERQVAGHVS